MQGPYSKGMNCAMLKDFNIRYFVTKDSGISNGFIEKMEAALECSVTLIVVASNYHETEENEQEALKYLHDKMSETQNGR